MISVILSVQENEAGSLADTLENLVHYAVEGFVQEVVVLHDGLDRTALLLAEEAGCNIRTIDEGLSEICQDARGDWLLFMEPGALLETGWADVVSAHARADGGAAAFKIKVSAARPWWQRLIAPRTFKRPLASGLLISKRQARANLRDQKTPVELMRGLAMKRLGVGIYPSS